MDLIVKWRVFLAPNTDSLAAPPPSRVGLQGGGRMTDWFSEKLFAGSEKSEVEPLPRGGRVKDFLILDGPWI